MLCSCNKRCQQVIASSVNMNSHFLLITIKQQLKLPVLLLVLVLMMLLLLTFPQTNRIFWIACQHPARRDQPTDGKTKNETVLVCPIIFPLFVLCWYYLSFLLLPVVLFSICSHSLGSNASDAKLLSTSGCIFNEYAFSPPKVNSCIL